MPQPANKPTAGPKTSPPKPTKAAPPEPVEEEIPAEDVTTEEEAPAGEELPEEETQESGNLEFSDVSDEECEKQVDEAIQALQINLARKAAGPKQMKAGTEGLVDEVLLPLVLALLSWWRNRQKS